MSVYIPDIAPPESCDKCTHPTCTLWQNREPDGRHEDCPILEIGTHGRLIDADKLMDGWMNLRDAVKYGNKTAEQQSHSYSTLMMYEIADEIEDAPTVIPGDRKE